MTRTLLTLIFLLGGAVACSTSSESSEPTGSVVQHEDGDDDDDDDDGDDDDDDDKDKDKDKDKDDQAKDDPDKNLNIMCYQACMGGLFGTPERCRHGCQSRG